MYTTGRGTFKSLGILIETTLEVKQEKESTTGCYAIGYPTTSLATPY